MKKFDILLQNRPEFRSHLHGRLRTALETTIKVLRNGVSRRERTGMFVNSLRTVGGISVPSPTSGYDGRYRYRVREFPGVQDVEVDGKWNPHSLAKQLERELFCTSNWVEPCVLREDPYNEGSEMETLTRRVVREAQNQADNDVSFNEARSFLDEMRFCVEDANKLAQSALVEKTRFANDIEEIENQALKTALG